MTFLEDDGTEIKVEAELGATLLEVAHENDVELEGGVSSCAACADCCEYTGSNVDVADQEKKNCASVHRSVVCLLPCCLFSGDRA